MSEEPRKSRAESVSLSLFKKKDEVKVKKEKERDKSRDKDRGKEKDKKSKESDKSKDKSKDARDKSSERDKSREKSRDGDRAKESKSKESDKSRDRERSKDGREREKPQDVTRAEPEKEKPLTKQTSVPVLAAPPVASPPVVTSPLSPSTSQVIPSKEKKNFFKGGDKASAAKGKSKEPGEYDSVDVAFFGASKETIGRDFPERERSKTSSFFGGKPKGRDQTGPQESHFKKNPNRPVSTSIEDVDAKFFNPLPVKNERSTSTRRLPNVSSTPKSPVGKSKDVSGSVKSEFQQKAVVEVEEEEEEYDILNDDFPTIKLNDGVTEEEDYEEYDIINGTPPSSLPPTLPLPTSASLSVTPRSPRPDEDDEYDLLRDDISPRPKSPRSKSPRSKSPRSKSPRQKEKAAVEEDEEYDILRDDEANTVVVQSVDDEEETYDLLRDDDDLPVTTTVVTTVTTTKVVTRVPQEDAEEEEDDEEYAILVSPRPVKSAPVKSPRSPREEAPQKTRPAKKVQEEEEEEYAILVSPRPVSPRAVSPLAVSPRPVSPASRYVLQEKEVKSRQLSPRPHSPRPSDDDDQKPPVSPKRQPMRKSNSTKSVKGKPLDEKEWMKREKARERERAEQKEREEGGTGVVAFISSRSFSTDLPDSELEKEIDKFLYLVTNRPPITLLYEKGILIDDTPKIPPTSPRKVNEEVVVVENTVPSSPRKQPASPRGQVVRVEPLSPPEPAKVQVVTADGKTVTSKRQTTRKIAPSSSAAATDVANQTPQEEDSIAAIKVDPLFATRRRYRHIKDTGEPEVNLSQPGMEGNYKVGWSHGFDPLFASGAMISEMGKDNAGLSTTVG